MMELAGTGRVTRKSIKIPLEYVAGATIGLVPRARLAGARRLCFISRQVERGFLPGERVKYIAFNSTSAPCKFQ
jgi:hypothetical protein